MALNGVPPSDIRYASELFSLMRNLGGAIGIATVTTWLQDDSRIHGERFGEALASANTSGLAQAAAHIARNTADVAHNQLMLAGELAQYVTRQAMTLAFDDVFLAMAALFVAALVLVPFCKTAILGDHPVHIE